MAALRSAYIAVALKIQEAVALLSDNDKRTRLDSTLHDIFRGTGKWAYLVDVFGDDQSGNVIYSSDGDLWRAPYTIADNKCAIDTTVAKEVFPLTTYVDEAVSAVEAGARNSKADMGHITAIHDAAVSLGAMCSGSGKKESKVTDQSGSLKLVESAAFTADITIREALAPGKKIKLIAPGKGSSAFYTVEALKKAAADKIFHAGLPMRIDHPTKAEEAARPEGSVKDWGAVLGTDAVWLDSYISGGKDAGAGLYSDIKTFSDHEQIIEEKGPYAGVSIRANGNAVMEASGRALTRDGVPVLKEFTSAEGADMVTRAGAGGLFLQEVAIPAANPTNQEASMDAEELKLLRESLATQQAATSMLLEKERRRDAIAKGAEALASITGLSGQQKEYIIGTVLKEALPVKDGALDATVFVESVNAEAKRFAAALGGSGRVTGMGAPAPVAIDAKEAERKQADQKARHARAVKNFQSMSMTEAAAKAAADKLIGEVA